MNKKYYYLIAITLMVLILAFLLFNNTKEEKSIEEVKATQDIEIKEEKQEDIIVDIKGAIKKPGIYNVKSSNRVNDVIKLAGGLNKDANTNYINLSAKVKDEMVIWIYTNSEIKKLKLEQSSTQYMVKECNCPIVDNTACLNNQTSNSTTNNNGLVNINSASLEELMTLPGIGESKAKTIVEYRNKNGLFKKKEDIMNVSGIGESAYNKIKDNITV